MKLDFRDWRVILGAGIVFLLVIGIYFGRRYQSSDARLKSPPPVVSVPATPLDTPSTVIAPQPDSGSEIVIYDAEAAFEAPRASAASEKEQSIRNSMVQLRAERLQLKAELNQLINLRNETSMERSRAIERLEKEEPAKEKAVDIEANRLRKIIDEKLSPNPTAEEYLAIEEWHQLKKLHRENDPLEAILALEDSYSQKITEIEQKTDKYFEELSVIKGMINQLASELEAEGAE